MLRMGQCVLGMLELAVTSLLVDVGRLENVKNAGQMLRTLGSSWIRELKVIIESKLRIKMARQAKPQGWNLVESNHSLHFFERKTQLHERRDTFKAIYHKLARTPKG